MMYKISSIELITSFLSETTEAEYSGMAYSNS